MFWKIHEDIKIQTAHHCTRLSSSIRKVQGMFGLDITYSVFCYYDASAIYFRTFSFLFSFESKGVGQTFIRAFVSLRQ